MKLYFSPGACSLSPHIVLREAGLPFELVKIALKTHTLPDGRDFYTVSPKGQVPLLELDDGQVLSEGPAIVQYVADLAPASGLAPAPGTLARYRLAEWLNYIGTELHKSFGPLFNPTFPADAKPFFTTRLAERFAFVDRQLEGRSFLLGDSFTAADAYLFTVQNWAPAVGLDISGLTHLAAWRTRVAARPAVQAALQAEGLKG